MSAKLVLHFDVRNTVLVADSVTNVTVEDALNSYLTSVAWGTIDADNNWRWCSDEPTIRKPRSDAVSFYKYLESTFVRTPEDRVRFRMLTSDFSQTEIGAKFRQVFEEHLRLLRIESNESQLNPLLTMRGKDGQPYHYLLPSFIRLIDSLYSRGRDFSIVLRTYGLDAPNVLSALEETIEGRNSDLPSGLPLLQLNKTVYNLKRNRSKFCLTPWRPVVSTDSCKIISVDSEAALYDWFSSVTGVAGVVDDFHFWLQNGYDHAAAKPFWIDREDQQRHHHIFFDDNFRAEDVDSIIDVRYRNPTSLNFESASLSQIPQFEGAHLVQTDLLEAIRNINYFVQQVAMKESALMASSPYGHLL